MTLELSIAQKIFLSDRRGGTVNERYDRFLGWLTPDEAAHPVGKWLVEQRSNPKFSWNEHAYDFASDLLGLPRKPLFVTEVQNDDGRYEKAASELEIRLTTDSRH